MTSRLQAIRWLIENGPKELEQLLWAIIYASTVPILIADSDPNCREASLGAIKLLDLQRAQVIGHRFSDFAQQGLRPLIAEHWRAFLDRGEQYGTLRLKDREIEYMIKANVLPMRHLLVLWDRATQETTIPSWAQDFAMFLLDEGGEIVVWYSGAQRTYGYSETEAVGQPLSFLYPGESILSSNFHHDLKRAVDEGHFGNEGWHTRKDGSQFWAKRTIMALNNAGGALQGFAGIVRNFDDRQGRDEELRLKRTVRKSLSTESDIVGVVSGEFDQIVEVNDRFLDILGYSREDLLAGRLGWLDLTPAEYFPLDELAQEELLQFGACAPFEKELIHKNGSRVPVLVVTASLKLSPFRWITFIQKLKNADHLARAEEKPVAHICDEIVGNSATTQRLLGQIEALSHTDANVLILGEPGTGKGLIAGAIHRLSRRGTFPFVTLNCASIPGDFLEREIFGYEIGAFSGALSQKLGRLEMAHGGTLLLEEIGDVPLDLRAKLVRALHEKLFERLGSTRTIAVDVRLLATTRRSLNQLTGDTLFRPDSYHDLKVFPLFTAPLRDHSEDILTLVWHFTKKYSLKLNRTIEKIQPGTMRALTDWPWPGNVRELESFIVRAVNDSRGLVLHAPLAELQLGAGSASTATLAEVEREYILRVFRESDGVISTTATILGIPRTTLNAMMKKLGVSRGDL